MATNEKEKSNESILINYSTALGQLKLIRDWRHQNDDGGEKVKIWFLKHYETWWRWNTQKIDTLS